MTGPWWAILIVQVFVFGLVWLIGLPAGLIHPRGTPGAHANLLAMLLGPVAAMAFVAAVAGHGGISGWLWFASVVTVIGLDIDAIVKRVRWQRILRRANRQVGSG